MTDPQLHIIILNWNGWPDTLRCLESLENTRYPKSNIRISVVDNGSTDSSVQMIEPCIRYNYEIVRNKTNIGFAQANNRVIIDSMEWYEPDFIWMLNNDTIVNPHCITNLVYEAGKDSHIGFVQPKMLRFQTKIFPDHHIIDSTGHIVRWGMVKDRGNGEEDRAQYQDAVGLIGASGAAAFMNVDMIRDIGLLDARFFAGYEDSEYSWRAWKRGWKTAYAPRAVVFHKRGASMQRMAAVDKEFMVRLYSQAGLPCMMHGTALQKVQFALHMMYDGVRSEVGKRIGRNNVGAAPQIAAIRGMFA